MTDVTLPRVKPMRICFLVGSVKISGGTYVIFQHAHYLQSCGYQVTLAVQEPFNQGTVNWHDYAKELNIIPIEQSFDIVFDIVIATWWKTALELRRYPDSILCYFVQSIESRFYPGQDKPLKCYVDSTYDLDVHFCTEAVWIKDYLKARHNKTAALVPNGIRKDVYKQRNTSSDRELIRLLIEGPFNVGFKNTGLAITAARRAGADEIWVLTSSPVNWLPRVDRVFSKIPILETAGIYQQCDVLIKLSTVEGMFGPPLEMFHCGGTAIVLDVTGHDEYIEHRENGFVISAKSFDSIVESISGLLRDKELIKNLSKNAAKTAKGWPDWNQSSLRFRDWIDDIYEKGSIGSDLSPVIANAEKRYVDEEKSRLSKTSLPAQIELFIKRILARSPEKIRNSTIRLIAYWEILKPHKKVKG